MPEQLVTVAVIATEINEGLDGIKKISEHELEQGYLTGERRLIYMFKFRPMKERRFLGVTRSAEWSWAYETALKNEIEKRTGRVLTEIHWWRTWPIEQK